MIIFLLVLCIFFLLALTSVYVFAEFDEAGLCGYIKFLFLRIKFPAKKKYEKDNKKDKKLKPQKKPGKMSDLKILINPMIRALGRMIKFLCVRNLGMDITIGTEDAFLTAMLYGGTAAGVGAIFPVLEQNMKIKKKSINVMADFSASETTVYANVEISLTLWQITVITYVFLTKYLKKVLNKRKDDNNGGTCIK